MGARLFIVGLLSALVAAMLSFGASTATAATTGSIRGTVTSEAADFDRTDVFVVAYKYVYDDEWDESGWTEMDEASINSQGRYNLSGLAPGTYRIGFEDYSGAMQAQYWNNKPDIEDAEDISIVAGQVVTGIDAVLVSAPLLVNSAPLTITGSPTPGSALKATLGTWTPTPSGLYYEWLANGREIDYEYGDTFVPNLGHLGKSISVRVYAFKTGYRVAELRSGTVQIAPATPSSLRIARKASSATFSWNISAGATGYRLTILSGSKEIGRFDNLQSTQFQHSNLIPNTAYTAKLEAVYGDYYASAPHTVAFRTIPINKATGLRATSRKAKSAMIAWAAVDGAQSYEMSYRAAGKPTKVRRTIDRGVMLRGLKPGTKYTVEVKTIARGGASYSISRSFTFKTRKK